MENLCPSLMKATSNGIFQGDNPLNFALPLAILQICLVVVGGILLGPSALGRNKGYLNAVFPPKSITVLDTLANIGLLFFLFLAGLELDVKSLRLSGNKVLAITVAGISLPFSLGVGCSFVLRETIAKGVNATSFLVFMGVALSITAFPVLARILAELKLLTTSVGRMAMSAAAVNDVAAWILLAFAIALSGDNLSPVVSLWVFLCGCGFVLGASLIVPPIFKWVLQCCHEGEPVDEIYICGTLVAVLAAGFVTDIIGIHAMFGAFVFGVLIPKEGLFAGVLVEKVEDLVSGLSSHCIQAWGLLVLVIFTACFGKIVATFIVSVLLGIPKNEALALGFLMNSKGLVELIVLNIGKDRKVLNDQSFAIMVLMALFTTFITTPLVLAVYKRIQRKNPNTQLRILTCFRNSRNIPSIINLLEASRGTERGERLCVYAMHLMEFSERPSAILMVHKARHNGLPFWNKGQQSASHVVVAFEAFQQLSQVSVRPMTSISSLSDMHEDICITAEWKKIAIIILPYHKNLRLDGSFDSPRSDFHLVNKRVLEHASCSVGIFVDRGLGGTAQISASNISFSITVLFFGAHDDREALAYGACMAEHPGVELTVIRFLGVSDNSSEEIVRIDTDSTPATTFVSADEEFLTAFRASISDDSSIKYEEKNVRNVSETITILRDYSRCNLFLVGRMPNGVAALALSQRIDCPELGPIGSLLSSLEFSTTASVLVVQQYYDNSYAKSSQQMVEDLVPAN
ncbi:unnamed protein product [Withania somnifera]